MTIFLVASMSCASVGEKASKPFAASQPCLDMQGQRELLAGVELEIGDARAKTAACQDKMKRMQADHTQSKVMWGVIGALLGAAVAGVAIGATR